MHPILFKIGNVTLYTHGFLALVGIISGSILIYGMAKKNKFKTDLFFDNIIFSVLAGIIGARISYYLIYRDQFSSFFEIIRLWEGGLVSYGGFLFGGLTFYLLIKYQKENIAKWFDLFSIGFFLGLFFGRLGNLAAGEYAGVNMQKGINIGGVFPATALEAGLCLALFVTGLLLYYLKKKPLNGTLFYILILLYSAGRFVIDIWRNEPKVILVFSLGQIFDIIVLLFGITGLYIFSKRKVRHEI